jgi:hypothetical protein
MLRSLLALGLVQVLLAGGIAAVEAKEGCKKQCFEAETCPIVGSKCLKFEWCRDACNGEATGPQGNESSPRAPDAEVPPASAPGPLPGPKEI